MAKKKTTKKTNDEDKVQKKIIESDEQLIKQVLKTVAGANILDKNEILKRGFISTCNLGLNYICSGRFVGGGIPLGRVTEVYGPSSSAKTVIATQVLKGCQEAGGIAVLIDSENAFSPDFAEALGLDTQKLLYFAPSVSPSAETLEGCWDTIVQSIQGIREFNPTKPIVVVYDSIAASPSRKEFEEMTQGKEHSAEMGLRARISSAALRTVAGFVPKHNAAVVVVNQVRDKIGCVDPDSTTIECNKKECDTAFKTVRDLFWAFSLNINEMRINEPVDVSSNNISVASFDESTGQKVFSKVLTAVRKDNALAFEIKVGSCKPFKTSGDHRIKVQLGQAEDYVEVAKVYDLLNNKTAAVKCFTEDTNSFEQNLTIKKLDETILIVDVEVEDTNCYFANGLLNHNTMFGNPETTAGGGNSLEYYCSVRIRCQKQKQIVDDKKRIAGITLLIKNTKNKVAKPFRRMEKVQLFFDLGIDPFGGLLECAIDAGVIEPAGKGWYCKTGEPDNKFQASQEKNIIPMEWVLNNPTVFNAETKEDIEKFLGIAAGQALTATATVVAEEYDIDSDSAEEENTQEKEEDTTES